MSSNRSNRTQPSPSASEKSPVEGSSSRHERFGWTTLVVWLSFGALLESFLGFRSEALTDPLRRELWSLAHFHGAMLALLNLVYARYAARAAGAASLLLIIGSVLMPLGFFLGGLSHPEGDPGIGILLVPAGALCVIAAIAERAAASFRSR